MLTLGAASGAIGLNASVQNGEPWHRLMRTTLAERDDDELPHARAVPANIAAANLLIDWRDALRAMRAGVSAPRGEELPPRRWAYRNRRYNGQVSRREQGGQ